MIKRLTWFVGGAVAGVAGVGVAKRKVKQAATQLTPKHIVHGVSDQSARRRQRGSPGDASQRARAARPARRARPHAGRRSRRRRRGAGRRSTGRAGPGHRAQAGPRSKRRRGSPTGMTDTLVAELGAGAVARPGPRRRHRAGAVPARRVEHRRSCRRRVLPDHAPPRCRPAFASPFATAGRSSPAAPGTGSGRRGDAARRRGADRHHEDEPGAVGRPGQPPGLGRAGRAQPRPHAGPSRRTACTSLPTRAASRAARSAATSPTTPAARTAWPTVSPRRTSSASRSCCPTARSCSSAARKPEPRWLRPARRVRRQRGHVRHRHQGVRAPHAEPAGRAHDADGLRQRRGRRRDGQRDHRRRHGAGGAGDDGSAVHPSGRGVHPRRACRSTPRRSCSSRSPACRTALEADVATHRRHRHGPRRGHGADRQGRSRAGAAVEGPQERVRRDRPHQAELLPARHRGAAPTASRGASSRSTRSSSGTTCW